MAIPFGLLAVVAVVASAAPRKKPTKILIVGLPAPSPQPLTTMLDVPLYGVGPEANPQSRQWEVVSTVPAGYVPDGKWLPRVWMELAGKPPKHDGHLNPKVYEFPIPMTVTAGKQSRNWDASIWRTRVRPDGGIDLEAAIRVGWHVARVRTTWTFARL